MHRDFAATGEEALAPPTKQNAFAVFGLQSFRLRTRVAAVRRHGSKTIATTLSRQTRAEFFRTEASPVSQVPRAFVLRPGTAARSLRTTLILIERRRWKSCTTLDHIPGNLAFEIGNPNLKRELGDGVDFGIRHSSKRLRFEANGFYYHIRDFVFLAPTGDVEDGLTVAEYDQGHSALRRHRSAFRCSSASGRSGSISDLIT